MDSFNLIASVTLNEEIVVESYKSETGFTLILARMKGPVIHTYFVIPTERHDNPAVAFTLEELIFKGFNRVSQQGFVHKISNKYRYQTKIQDHACYVLDMACNEGITNLLPVYLDHILFPLPLAEIDNIDQNEGIITPRLLIEEHDCNAMIIREVYRHLYPETDFLLEVLSMKKDCSIEEIRDYHTKHYAPANTTIFIAGPIEPDEIFTSLQDLETKIKNKELESFERSFNTELTPLEENIVKTIEYHSEEESTGFVCLAWRGPNIITEYENFIACKILLKYLCGSSISPIQRLMLEIENPLASHISYQFIECLEVIMLINLSGINLDRISEVDEKLMEVLNGIVEEGIDMKRMETVIKSELIEFQNSLERNPYLTVFEKLLPTMIYAEETANEEIIQKRLCSEDVFAEMLEKPNEYWIEIFLQYFISGKHVTIEAIPCSEKLQSSTEEEEEEQPLNDLEDILIETQSNEDLIVEKEEPSPDETTSDPDGFLWSLRYCSSKGSNPPNINLQKMPFYTEAYDLSTSFVHLSLTINTDSVPTDLRLYLPLFIELLIKSPIEIDDEIVSIDEITSLMEEDLISVSTNIGIQSVEVPQSFLPYSNHLQLSMQVQMEKYESGINWMHKLLHKSTFVQDRIKSCCMKLLNQMVETKRNNRIICRQIIDAMFYDPTSNIRLHSILKQQQFLSEVVSKIEEDQTEEIIEQLNLLRDILLNPNNNISVHIATDWSKLASLEIDLLEPWTNAFPQIELDDVPKKLYVLPDFVFFELLALPEDVNGVIVGRSSSQSSHLFQAVRSINDYRDTDLPALIVLLEYLTQPESTIFRSLKSKGLACDFSIDVYPNEGLLVLSVLKSKHIVTTYHLIKVIIEKHLEETFELSERHLEVAKNSALYNAVNSEGTIAQLVMRSIIVGFQEVPYDWNKVFIKKLQRVTVEDLKEVGQKHLTNLVSADSRVSCICPLEKTEEIQSGLNELGMNLQVEPSLNESILANF
ncbi:uncharacterized protein C05D11.1-like [Culicoides brevitarsis]|uniref:uncharacterized protein C05D11.1-like n=1 Tax=Culicoides brevitarsis TaxID=469753 RepID=UPI00307BBE0D